MHAETLTVWRLPDVGGILELDLPDAELHQRPLGRAPRSDLAATTRPRAEPLPQRRRRARKRPA